MEPYHLETFASGCALAAVLKDAGNTEAPGPFLVGDGHWLISWFTFVDVFLLMFVVDVSICKCFFNKVYLPIQVQNNGQFNVQVINELHENIVRLVH